jgi:RNA polymerase primary sigma factor
LKITNQITNRESRSLDKYFKEISREKLITAGEEADLAQKIKLGDEKAMQKLIKANLRFVVSVAKQYQNRGLPLSDLINEGNIGLMKAAERFDETLGFKFISYAVWLIRRSILDSLDEHSRLVRLPPRMSDMFYKISKASMKMEHEFQREPSNKEVGEELCISEKVIANVIKSSTKVVSLETPVAGSDNLTLMEVLEDKGAEDAEQQFINKSLRPEIENAISTLPCNETSVLRLYFGLNDGQPLTLEEIGSQFGLTGIRVRQLKEKGIFSLKNASRYKYLKEYLC